MAAPPERVWRAWVEPTELTRWQADEVVAVGDQLVFSWPTLGASIDVELVRCEKQRRLELKSDNFAVDVHFEPGAVTLIHKGTASGEETEGMMSSWRVALALLRHYLERHWGSPRNTRWFLRSARVPAETAYAFFSDAAALATWLGHGSALGETGTSYALELFSGDKMSGTVLCNTPGRDVAISWVEQHDSALVLRTLPSFRSSEERNIVLSWSDWGRPAATDRALTAGLDAALERLVRRLEVKGQA